MIISQMEYKQIHVVGSMNFDTDSRCKFKTYPLENNSTLQIFDIMIGISQQELTHDKVTRDKVVP